jgi:hypothetical protein
MVTSQTFANNDLVFGNSGLTIKCVVLNNDNETWTGTASYTQTPIDLS